MLFRRYLLYIVDSIITVLRFLQVENANGQISITLSGITIAGKLKQQVNAALPITVTVRGIVTLVKEVQAENASISISVTPVGIVVH